MDETHHPEHPAPPPAATAPERHPREERHDREGAIQNEFFNRARKSGERLAIYLLNGKRVTGRIRSFDRYTVLVDAGSEDVMIYKHAISSVSTQREAIRRVPAGAEAGAAAPGAEGAHAEAGSAGQRPRGPRPDRPRGPRPDRPPRPEARPSQPFNQPRMVILGGEGATPQPAAAEAPAAAESPAPVPQASPAEPPAAPAQATSGEPAPASPPPAPEGNPE